MVVGDRMPHLTRAEDTVTLAGRVQKEAEPDELKNEVNSPWCISSTGGGSKSGNQHLGPPANQLIGLGYRRREPKKLPQCSAHNSAKRKRKTS